MPLRKKNTYEDLEQLSVPAHTWAVFPNEGPFPQTLQETWAGYSLNGCLHLVTKSLRAPEISFTQYQGPAEAKYSEIWLAVTATK